MDFSRSCGVCCCGQIQRMRLFGICCWCLESESDKLFRLADLTLQVIPVLWFRKIKHDTTYNNNSNSYCLCGLGGEYTNVEHMIDDDNQRVNKYSPYMPLNATLSLVDTRWHGPALQIASNQFVFADDDVTTSNQPGAGVTGNISDRIEMTKTIPLCEIDCATSATREECLSMNGLPAGAEDFVVILKSKHTTYKGTRTKLLVLHVLPSPPGQQQQQQQNNANNNNNNSNQKQQQPSSSSSCPTTKKRDELIDKINMMLTWNGMQMDKNKKDSVANANVEIVNSKEVPGTNFVLMGNSSNKEEDKEAMNKVIYNNSSSSKKEEETIKEVV